MTSNFKTILIIGATSGIGEGFARRFHGMGKKVIATGRRAEKLSALAKELPGLETRQWDITNFAALQDHVAEILASHPALDTVFLNASTQKAFSVFSPETSSTESITSEVAANLTAPILLARLFVPHLAALAATGKPTALLITSSALAYVPLSFYPVYCPTKAAIHSFCVVLRQQLGYASEEVKRNMSVVEVAPPYTDTGLDAEHRTLTEGMQGGKDKAVHPMPLEEYLERAFVSLEEVDDEGRLKKEVGVGFAQMGIDTWRGGFGKILEGMGINC